MPYAIHTSIHTQKAKSASGWTLRDHNKLAHKSNYNSIHISLKNKVLLKSVRFINTWNQKKKNQVLNKNSVLAFLIRCYLHLIFFYIFNKYHKISVSICQKNNNINTCFTHMNWLPAILLSASLTHSKTTGFPLSSRYAPFCK